MGHMEIGILVGTGLIERTRSNMVGSWTLRRGEVIDIVTILVLVLTDIMLIVVIILTVGVIEDTF